MKTSLLIAVLAISTSLMAETKTPEPAKPATPPVAAVPAPQPPPVLSDIEALALQGLAARFQEFNVSMQSFENEIAKAHPGYSFDLSRNTFVSTTQPVAPPPQVPEVSRQGTIPEVPQVKPEVKPEVKK